MDYLKDVSRDHIRSSQVHGFERLLRTSCHSNKLMISKQTLLQIIAHGCQRIRNTLSALIIALMVIGVSSKAMAAQSIPVIVLPIAGTPSLQQLELGAGHYLVNGMGYSVSGYVGVITAAPTCGSGPSGATILLAVSTAAPISSSFYECKSGSSMQLVVLTATTNAQTISSDALLLARSAKTMPINLAPGYSARDNDGPTSEWLASAAGVPLIGNTVSSFWHGLTNMGQTIQGTFINTATGEKFTLWNGDVITVTDADGYTSQYQWTPLSTIHWSLVPNSTRYKGNPPGVSQLAPPSDALPGAAVSISYPSGPTITITPYDNPLPTGTITVGDPIDISIPIPDFECLLSCPD